MKETLAIIAGVLAVVGNVPYLRDIVRRRVEPHPYTWLVWTLVTSISFFGQLAKGAGVGVIPTGVALFFTFGIFCFSLRYGLRHIRRVDALFLAAALVGAILWPIIGDPTISVIIAVIIDLIAYIPTIRKTWQYPTTEAPILYEMNLARHVLTLFSLEAYNIATTLHSFAMIAANFLMTVLIVRRGKTTGDTPFIP